MTTELVTETHEYQPTAAEARLLEVLSDPLHFRKSITEKCELADIARKTYYEVMKRPEFVTLIPKTALDLVKTRAMDLINASYDAALRGSFSDREMLLEMAGIREDKKNQGVNIQNNTFVVTRGE